MPPPPAPPSDLPAHRALLDRVVGMMNADADAARHWFATPRVALGGATPLALAATPEGLREVERLVEQIGHGVYD